VDFRASLGFGLPGKNRLLADFLGPYTQSEVSGEILSGFTGLFTKL
jgi:hypothetical protein